jgi:hypothetical protein
MKYAIEIGSGAMICIKGKGKSKSKGVPVLN